MKELTLTAEQLAVVTAPAASAAPAVLDDAALMAMPLVDAKRFVAAEFERRYLVCLMARVDSVSEGARVTGIDRTNFRRLLQRHGLR